MLSRLDNAFSNPGIKGWVPADKSALISKGSHHLLIKRYVGVVLASFGLRTFAWKVACMFVVVAANTRSNPLPGVGSSSDSIRALRAGDLRFAVFWQARSKAWPATRAREGIGGRSVHRVLCLTGC